MLDAIAKLRLSLELCGDGGFQPFDDSEYKSMYELLDKVEDCIRNHKVLLENDIKSQYPEPVSYSRQDQRIIRKFQIDAYKTGYKTALNRLGLWKIT